MFVSVTYYISLYVGEKQLVFHLNPRDNHVIIVSGHLILTAVLIHMAYIADRLVSFCARSNVTFHISLHELCVQVGAHTLRHNHNFSDGEFTKFSYPWYSASRMRELHYYKDGMEAAF